MITISKSNPKINGLLLRILANNNDFLLNIAKNGKIYQTEINNSSNLALDLTIIESEIKQAARFTKDFYCINYSNNVSIMSVKTGDEIFTIATQSTSVMQAEKICAKALSYLAICDKERFAKVKDLIFGNTENVMSKKITVAYSIEGRV